MLKQKEIKQQQMDFLARTFKDVRDVVFLSPSGLAAQAENRLRLDLRKKNIRLLMVKNSLMKKVFDQMGMKVQDFWTGPTVVAWGHNSLADLSKELEKSFKGNTKVKFKGALADGQPVTFEQATKMPTRLEAIGRVVQLFLSPGSRLVSQIKGPAAGVASQIKSISEKKEGEGAPAEAAAASAEAAAAPA